MSKLFQRPEAPSMPKVQGAKRMPTMTDPNIEESARRRREAMMRRKGAFSTILSDSLSGENSGTLG